MPASKEKPRLETTSERLLRMELEVEYEKKANQQRDEILKQAVMTQQMMGEKMIAIEVRQINHGEDICSLKKDTKLQNKVLAAILTSSIATVLGLIAKAILTSHGS